MSLHAKQLEKIVLNWKPDVKLDIHGIIIDYLHRSSKGLYEILKMNTIIYEHVFVDGDRDQCKNLLVSIFDPNLDQKLIEQFNDDFPLVSRYLAEVTIKDVTKSMESAPKASEFMKGISPNAIIWQLSDLHFGKFNNDGDNPIEIASKLSIASHIYEHTKPDYIIISGDITSISHDSEYEKFIQFTKKLSKEIWKSENARRIFVIPGNHDTSYLETGSADRCEKFRAHLSANTSCIIPFGEVNESFNSGNINVARHFSDDGSCPPFTKITIEDIHLEILLLISSYYSGEVPKEILEAINRDVASAPIKESLYELMRIDSGLITHEYTNLIVKNINNDTRFNRIAVNHHNLIQFGSEIITNKNAFQFLRHLYNKKVDIILHGHIHMFEDMREDVRSHFDNMPFCIPCTTLSSHPFRRSPGFLVHYYVDSDQAKLITFAWERSGGDTYDDNLLTFLYETPFR